MSSGVKREEFDIDYIPKTKYTHRKREPERERGKEEGGSSSR